MRLKSYQWLNIKKGLQTPRHSVSILEWAVVGPRPHRAVVAGCRGRWQGSWSGG